eukprot:scaffold2462_cov127-Cylindrotheca_fusiformis.AAC.5
MASKVTAVSAKLPSRRRRESSEELTGGSLASLGGSGFGTASFDKTSKDAASIAKKPNDSFELASNSSTKGSGSGISPSGRRPFRKRAGTVDFSLNLEDDSTLNLSNTDDPLRVLPAVDALPPIDSLPVVAMAENDSNIIREGRSQSSSLDRLDALGNEAGEAAGKIIDARGRRARAGSFSARSNHSDNSSSHGTMTSQSQRFLLEAFMGDAEESLMLDHRRERLGSFDTRERLGSFDVRDRLGILDGRDRLGSIDVRDRLASFEARERLGSDPRELSESFERARSGSFRRERLESWGAMSELSAPYHGDSGNESGSTSAAALAARLYTSLANDITAAANLDGSESVSSFLVNDEVVPTRISVNRSRRNSITSETSSALDAQASAEADLGADLHKFVNAAMASVGDQLAAATAAENPLADHESVASSTISPMIGAASDAKAVPTRPRSDSNASALNISVDYDAVAAAVDAAQAAARAIDLDTIAKMAPSTSSGPPKKRRALKLPTRMSSSDSQSSSKSMRKPTGALHSELPPIPPTKMDDKEMEVLRERARAAAGYVPPVAPGSTPLPPKKKARVDCSNPQTPAFKTAESHQTPLTSNSACNSATPSAPYTPAMSTPGSAKSTASKGQSSQKWDSMFDCLLEFIEERKKEDAAEMSEEEFKDWVWDGNVPTTYKTRDGKALGRWVNNQRSAKSKGVLKEDRENRLIGAGLKWSVLASNSWNEMLEELRIYVSDQKKAGRKWDGNVPTNYRIKTRSPNGGKDDEDKNLGRWVNRQRSLYQAGKLRKDRQHALEKVGLKWSMLATTSWESMYDTLCDYIQSKTKETGCEWDGNVPANYKTDDNPPRALGRWINRQRSAFGKDKLKPEYMDKLNKLGLKWSVHERRPVTAPDSVKSAPAPCSRPANATPVRTTSTPAPSAGSGATATKPTLPAAKEVAGAPTLKTAPAASSSTASDSKTGRAPGSSEAASATVSQKATTSVQPAPAAQATTKQEDDNATTRGEVPDSAPSSMAKKDDVTPK